MKKSPLSTPSSSKQKPHHSYKIYDRKNKAGYNHIKSDSYYRCNSPNEGQSQSGNDFIPLNSSTPVPERNKFNGNWRGSVGRNNRAPGSGGFNHYRNNYYSTPKSNTNNWYSHYKQSPKPFYSQKKGYHKDTRKVHLSNYIDMKSFLEDPWESLMEKLNSSKEDRSPKIERSLSPPSIYVNLDSNYESKFVNSSDNSQFHSKFKDDPSVSIALGLNRTDVSGLSRTESLIDLKLKTVGIDKKLSGSVSSTNSISGNTEDESNVSHPCGSTTNVIQNVI